MEIELKDPKPPSLNGFHSPAIRIPRETPSKQSSNYTSLKDILNSSSPSSSSPPVTTPAAMFSPAKTTSWNEIPIRNPLVKHAAMAYLQPMSTPTASFRGKGCAARLAEKCDDCLAGCGEEFGCLAWFCDVVSKVATVIFAGGLCGERRSGEGFDDESDEDEDEEDD